MAFLTNYWRFICTTLVKYKKEMVYIKSEPGPLQKHTHMLDLPDKLYFISIQPENHIDHPLFEI